MEFVDVVRRRRMVRAYDPGRPVPAELRERIVAHALRAPSAGFSQGWAFVVLEGDDTRRYWTAVTNGGDPEYANWQRGLDAAPLLIICLSHKDGYLDRYAEPDKGLTDRSESHWCAPYWHIDTGMAALLMLLTAVDAELGACFFGMPVERIDAVKSEFGIPATYHPIGVVSVGYPAPDDRPRSLRHRQRDVAEVVHKGHWGQQ